jgi:hypothetical protein
MPAEDNRERYFLSCAKPFNVDTYKTDSSPFVVRKAG